MCLGFLRPPAQLHQIHMCLFTSCVFRFLREAPLSFFLLLCSDWMGGKCVPVSGRARPRRSRNDRRDWWRFGVGLKDTQISVLVSLPLTISALPQLSDHPAAIGNAHKHTHQFTHTHINSYTQTVEFTVGEWGKVPANLGLPVLPLPFFPLTFTRLLLSPLLPSSLSPYTHFLYSLWWTQTRCCSDCDSYARNAPH